MCPTVPGFWVTLLLNLLIVFVSVGACGFLSESASTRNSLNSFNFKEFKEFFKLHIFFLKLLTK